jgi:hypothetical protein
MKPADIQRVLLFVGEEWERILKNVFLNAFVMHLEIDS